MPNGSRAPTREPAALTKAALDKEDQPRGTEQHGAAARSGADRAQTRRPSTQPTALPYLTRYLRQHRDCGSFSFESHRTFLVTKHNVISGHFRGNAPRPFLFCRGKGLFPFPFPHSGNGGEGNGGA